MAISPQTKKYVGYGLLAGGIGLAAYYAWSYYKATDRAKLTDVDIVDVGLTWIKLRLTITNYATVPIPFKGFSGNIFAKGFNLANVNSNADVGTIPASRDYTFEIKSNVNWSQMAGLVPNIVQEISAGRWQQLLPTLQPILKGDLYLNNIDVDVEQPLF